MATGYKITILNRISLYSFPSRPIRTVKSVLSFGIVVAQGENGKFYSSQVTSRGAVTLKGVTRYLPSLRALNRLGAISDEELRAINSQIANFNEAQRRREEAEEMLHYGDTLVGLTPTQIAELNKIISDARKLLV